MSRKAYVAVVSLLLIVGLASPAFADGSSFKWSWQGKERAESRSWEQHDKVTMYATSIVEGKCTTVRQDGSVTQIAYTFQLQKKSGPFYFDYKNVQISFGCKGIQKTTWYDAPEGKYRFLLKVINNNQDEKIKIRGRVFYDGAKP